MSKKYCIGIDLGTTNSVIAYYNEKSDSVEIIPNHIGDRLTPSCVSFDEGIGILVGKPAMESELVISHVKRLIGLKGIQCQDMINYLEYPVDIDKDGNPLISILNKKYKPEEISAEVLYYLKRCAEDYLGDKIQDVVITVPAYFSDTQRRATKDAATIAGLNCIRLVAEPTAACLCYGLHKQESEKILVYDSGGGTLDVSLLNVSDGIFEVISTDGNTQLGGADIDHIIMDFLNDEYLKQTGKIIKTTQAIAENIKKNLSSSTQTVVRLPDFKYIFTRELFEKLIENFLVSSLEPVENVLKMSGINSNDISQVVLVGGTTRIPILQRKLKELFGSDTILNKSVNPDEAVAIGAAIQASILKQVGSKCRDLLLLDVCPLSLGIETSGGVMNVIIKRNSTLPIEANKMFSNVDDYQDTVDIKIYQGERGFTKDCILLGTFTLSGLPKKPRGFHKIKVSFNLNCDGLLEVSAVDKNTGMENKIIIKPETNLTPEEVSKLLQEAEKYRNKDINLKKFIEIKKDIISFVENTQKLLNRDDFKNLLNDDLSNINKYLLECNNNLLNEYNEDIYSLDDLTSYKNKIEIQLKPILEYIYSYKTVIEKEKIVSDDVLNVDKTNNSCNDKLLDEVLQFINS